VSAATMSQDGRFGHSSNIKVIASTILDAEMLVLLTGGGA
jgi:hypothetical protein